MNILKSHLKSHGRQFIANGKDTSIISPKRPKNKEYGNSTTISFDVEDESTAKMILLSLAETVAERLRQDNMLAGVVAVSIVDADFISSSHQMTYLLRPIIRMIFMKLPVLCLMTYGIVNL